MGDDGAKIVRITSMASEMGEDNQLAVAVRDGQVMLVSFDSDDDTQLWVKFEKNEDGEVERDIEGCPGFKLMNKATGQMMKHPIAPHEPLQLCDPLCNDHSVLWTKTKVEMADVIRTFNNSDLNWDAFKGDADYVGIGTKVVVWEWGGGSNQKWGMLDEGEYCL